MNCSQVYSLPRTGRTSFANKKEQMKKQGKKIDRSKCNGTISDLESEEIIVRKNIRGTTNRSYERSSFYSSDGT